ncbi:MAG: hypothetical protein M3Z23_15765 [Acidobacteriota bacterium]|nr:hypothetical protein [Acidobacteriota bacterium]
MLLATGHLPAETVAVLYPEGSIHGFLALRTLEGKLLAAGDLTQVIHGSRVTSHLIFRFKDGSVDDETTVFTQRGQFRLVSDHHIQKGPGFPKPADVLIEAPTGQVTVRYKDKGRDKVESSHVDLPPDLANGLIIELIKNIAPDAKKTMVSYVAAAPKPRLVQLSITPEGKETFSVAGAHYMATRFKVKVELGGITGAVAPLIGKQPPDTYVWMLGGKAPAFIKLEGPQYEGSPIRRLELASPVWKRVT